MTCRPAPCTFPGCTRTNIKGRDLCANHYNSLVQLGNPPPNGYTIRPPRPSGIGPTTCTCPNPTLGRIT
jgi:hypothetical protein